MNKFFIKYIMASRLKLGIKTKVINMRGDIEDDLSFVTKRKHNDPFSVISCYCLIRNKYNPQRIYVIELNFYKKVFNKNFNKYKISCGHNELEKYLNDIYFAWDCVKVLKKKMLIPCI